MICYGTYIKYKERSKIAAFINLIKKIDYIEMVDIKEESQELTAEHRDFLDIRLQSIENGETTFKNWNLIKKKYEDKAV